MHHRKDWVVKANDLINARYDWTVLQQRMVLMMIAQLDGEAEDFGWQTIEVSKLLDRGQVSGNAYYDRVAEAAQVLLDQKIFVRQDKDRWRGYNLLSFVEPDSGSIKARFNPDMRPFLLQLKRRFTKYMLRNVMRFQSPYSTRIYELAMQFEDIGHRTIPIDALREMLVVEDKYPRFYDFRRRVLEQAKKEINEHTDLAFRYDVLREGRSAVAIKMHMRLKSLAQTSTESDSVDHKKKELSEDQREFEVWWEARSELEQTELRAEAIRGFDDFLLQLYKENPDRVAVKAAIRKNLFDRYMRLAGRN